VLFAILLAALGIAQAQMSFPDITQAAAAIQRVFGTIDRAPAITLNEDGAGAVPPFLSGCRPKACMCNSSISSPVAGPARSAQQ
jgi:hypothetical protein